VSIIRAIATLAVLDISAACQMSPPAVIATQSLPSALPAASLVGTWLLQSVDGIAIRPGDAAFSFNADGTVTGIIDCNNFRGEYTYRDGVIAFGPIALTERGCETVIQYQKVIEGSLGAGPYQFVAIGGDAAKLEGKQVLNIVRRR